MWYLQNIKDASFRLSLPAGKDLVVGRKDCDLLIPEDKSISRKHALIHVDAITQTSPVYLTDCKAKFGTQAGDKKLSSGEKVQLGHGNVVKFGQGPISSRFKVVFEPLLVCCSSMSTGDKQKVKQLVMELGGRLVGNWSSECSHLIMSSLTVTVKVVCALASCKPIVTLAWLEEALQCCRDNRALPNTANYQPVVVDEDVEKSKVAFTPNFARSSLFEDSVFYFFNESQMANLRTCLMAAGATRCVLINTPSSVAMDTLTVKGSVVVGLKDDMGSEGEREWTERVTEHLQSHELRTIAECEIGFALLHVSTEKYCNPKNKEGLGVEDIPLVPPSLSQMHFTQVTQSQPGPPHSLTQSQAWPSRISQSSSASILAPNTPQSTQQSLSMRQHSNGNSEMDSDARVTDFIKQNGNKVRETPVNSKQAQTAVKEESEPSRLRSRGTASKTSSNQKITDFIKPTGPVKAAQPSQSTVKMEPNSEQDVIEISQEAPIKKRGGLSLKKKLPKKSPIAESQDLILVPQSVESNQSAQDISILAPNSLTPGSTQKKGSGKLPGASLMTELFEGKQKGKRRGAPVEEDFSGRRSKRRRSKSPESNDLGIGEHFESVNCTPTKGNKESDKDTPKIGDSKKQRKSSLKDTLPKLDLYEDEPRSKGSPINENRPASPDSVEMDSPIEVRSKIPSGASNTDLTQTQGLVATSTQIDGGRKSPTKWPKVSPVASTTPFISSRKQKKTEPEAEMDVSRVPMMSFTEAADHNASLFTQDFLTPFTKLASSSRVTAPMSIFKTTGKRSKVNPETEADVLWLEEDGRGEGENPLGTQYDAPPTGKKYTPVLSEDGFIKARVKPKPQVSRMGRFTQMAKSEYLRSPDSPVRDPEEGGDSQECYTQISYQVEVVSLVMVGSGQHGARATVREEEPQNSRLRNFKKFRKVHNTGAGSMTQFPTLVRYVPPSNSALPDWTIVDDQRNGQDSAEEREDNSQNSQNIFNLPKAKRQRQRAK